MFRRVEPLMVLGTDLEYLVMKSFSTVLVYSKISAGSTRRLLWVVRFKKVLAIVNACDYALGYGFVV